MTKMFGILLSIAGAILTGWAGVVILGQFKYLIYGYDPVYVGLAGLGMLSLGLLTVQK